MGGRFGFRPKSVQMLCIKSRPKPKSQTTCRLVTHSFTAAALTPEAGVRVNVKELMLLRRGGFFFEPGG